MSWYSSLFQCNTIHHANSYKRMHFLTGIYPFSDSWLMIYNLLQSLAYLGFDGSKSCMFSEKVNCERRLTTELPPPRLWKLTKSHSEKHDKTHFKV